MTECNTIRDVLVIVAQQGRRRLGLRGWWTMLPDEWHRNNVGLVFLAQVKGMIRTDGKNGLMLTRKGRAWMKGRAL